MEEMFSVDSCLQIMAVKYCALKMRACVSVIPPCSRWNGWWMEWKTMEFMYLHPKQMPATVRKS